MSRCSPARASSTTGQWPGTNTIDDPNVNQFMAVERGNIGDEALHSDLVWPGGVELLERLGPSILMVTPSAASSPGASPTSVLT